MYIGQCDVLQNVQMIQFPLNYILTERGIKLTPQDHKCIWLVPSENKLLLIFLSDGY